jgi:secreted Zn-dependent insulinase-like peptidase
VVVGIDEPRNNVLLQLFNLTAKQPFFNQLRTVEQLGYSVKLQKMLVRKYNQVTLMQVFKLQGCGDLLCGCG